MKTIIITLLFCLLTLCGFGQSTEIIPGVILPSMSTTQRIAITVPANGMLVFDTNTQSYWYRKSGAWMELAGGGGSFWQISGSKGTEIKNTNSDGFWSANATTLPLYPSDVSNPPTAPIAGNGTRLMWIPSRSAFRVGTVHGAHWNADSLGVFSFASGLNTKALGSASTAMGNKTIAKGSYSIAIGYENIASGYSSTAMGYYTTASGYISTAMGSSNYARGHYSTAMGYHTTADGENSTTMGLYTVSSGYTSTAMGRNTTASGNYTTAMGNRVSTNLFEGSFIVGDSYNGSTLLNASASNRFHARFRNGYQFYTSANNSTFALLPAGASAWDTSSDSTRKENFIPSNNESVLGSVAQIRIGTWNYKGQDPATQRHWGVMAQDFHKHFGKDTYGTIGNDTTISTADFDGVAFAAIKGLEERTRVLSEKLTVNSEQLSEQLKTKSGRRCGEELSIENSVLRGELEVLRLELSKLKEKEEENRKRISALIEKFELYISQSKMAAN